MRSNNYIPAIKDASGKTIISGLGFEISEDEGKQSFHFINGINKGREMKASDILNKAIGHLSDRAVTYDKPQGERSMAKTVDAFNAIYDLGMTEVQGWHFMELLKMARSSQGAFKADNFEDGSAYAALAGEAAYNCSRESNNKELEIPYVIMVEAPEWANWTAEDKDGSFYWYQYKPNLGDEEWLSSSSDSYSPKKMHGYVSDEKFEDSLRRVYRSQEEADKANGKSAG